MNNVLVTMTGIHKAFPGVKALEDAQFELRAGEVHALVGENGAGKSTLMKILTGNYTKDAGSIRINGKEVDIRTPRAATALGISIIHQELSMIKHLTLAQNIFLGRENRPGAKFLVDEKRINAETEKIFRSMNLSLNPKTKAGELSVAKQQMVEIAKAVSFNSEIIIMDEPTAALTESEIEELFKVIADFKAKGAGIIYISHRMEELKRICDRVTVMRDGKYIATRDIAEITKDEIINLMVGRTIYETARAEVSRDANDIILEVKHLNRGNVIKDVSFQVRRGEILGFSGLMGAGRTEVARAVFGADAIDSGEIYVNGRQVKIKSPKDAVRCGIGYLSEDRKVFGLTLGLSVEFNTVLTALYKFMRFGVVDSRKTKRTAEDYVTKLKIKTPGTSQKTLNLSGGNQQKVVIAKWLLRDCDILIFDEPTRGIDVGAKSEIYKLLNDLSNEGKTIIMISSELPEIIRMSHRVIIMCEGRVTGELDYSELSQEKIMLYATKRQAHEGGA